MLEKEIEVYLQKQVKKIGGWALKFVSPGCRGVPDRIVLLPGAVIVFVEVKRPGGKLRKLQEHICDKIRSFGFSVVCLDSKEKIDQWTLEVQSHGI